MPQAATLVEAPVPQLRTETSGDLVPNLPIYLAVGLVAGSVIQLQIAIIRLFSIGSWAHSSQPTLQPST